MAYAADHVMDWPVVVFKDQIKGVRAWSKRDCVAES